jgi:hypothetical protein
MEGPVHVVTVHPPLPAPADDPALDLEICRNALAQLLQAYVRQFPEQCPTLAFTPRAPRADGAGSASRP